MRIKFVQSVDLAEVLTECPWAADIIEVDGGYQCFESSDDYATWLAQR